MSSSDGLAKNSLGVFESIIMGIAGTAPAFSVAVTSAAIVASVGVLSVGSILYCGLIMFGITLAFIHLSKIQPNAGAAYAWVGHVFGPAWGFFAGWGLLIASIFFMVSATIPAASSTLLLIAPDQAENTQLISAIAAVWLTVVSLIVGRGIKHSSFMQIALTLFESVILFVLIAGGLMSYWSNPAHPPSFVWISPLSFSPQLFATGALTAIFFFWGWDVTMNLSEESKGGQKNTDGAAGKGAFWSVLNMMLFFVLMMVVVLMVLTDREIANSGTNVLFAIANKLFLAPWSYLAVFCTIFSTVGTIETQILQFSRSMFAMARDGMLHPVYAKVHDQYKTPWVATFVIWFLGVVLLFSSSFMPSVKAILTSSILAIGFQICFYMSLTGFACAWHYRKKLNAGFGSAMAYVLWPGFSGAFMVFVGIYSIPTFDAFTIMMGVGGLLLGFLPLALSRKRAPATTR
ncbi:APC family permease [Polynucleobacter sp. AP-RePozz3-80-G7]|uniref:APC family permease n=1 Tax=Polynucleobacter sp. AP-RePozz3-80-G7 TaxID=2689105 RepID=UPI001D6F94F2|nr:APC family permease [Polynucleobacter sp. AP-RePozz3-80-G7]MBU3639711.1 APC family permease [Polynucleobacter sp. AP-RePozz3-80-G7]